MWPSSTDGLNPSMVRYRDPNLWFLNRMKTVEQVVDAIRVARESIVSCEYHLNAIRAVMDSIEKDAISREEMKPHLIRPKGKTSG